MCGNNKISFPRIHRFGNIGENNWNRPSYDLCYLSRLFSQIFPKRCILCYQNVLLPDIKPPQTT